MGLTNNKTIKLNMLLGVVEQNFIKVEDTKRSFRSCVLFPLDCRGAAQFKTEYDKRRVKRMRFNARAKMVVYYLD